MRRAFLIGLLSWACAAAPGRAGEMLADSEADFSGVQGSNGWTYGYYSGADFVTNDMIYSTWAWVGPDSGSPIIGPSYTHPGFYQNASAVRRWINTADRFIECTGFIQCTGVGPGDGIQGWIAAGPTRSLFTYSPVSDPSGIAYTSPVTFVQAGEPIDLVCHPYQNGGYDSSTLTMKVFRNKERGELVASSSRDFAGTQAHDDASGSGTWQYGEYPSGFSPSSFTTSGWSYVSYAWQNPGGSYLFIDRNGGHPDTVRIPVRRWTSRTGGTVLLDAGLYRSNSARQGDGIEAVLFHNDEIIFSETMDQNDYVTRVLFLQRTVEPGDTIDLAVSDRSNNGWDSFGFFLMLTRPVRPGTVFLQK